MGDPEVEGVEGDRGGDLLEILGVPVCDRGAGGALRPRARPEAARGVGAGGDAEAPSHHGGPGYNPRKIF